MEVASLNLYEKLIEIRTKVEKLKKDTVGKVGFADHPYISTDNILDKIMDKMNELKVLLQPSIFNCTEREFTYTNSKNQQKVDFITRGDMSFTWINAENPEEREVVQWFFFGEQDEVSKSMGSGLTYSQRYFLKMYFQIGTDEDDPDQRDTTGKSKSNQGSQTQTNVSNSSKTGANLKENRIQDELPLPKNEAFNKAMDEMGIAYVCSECPAEITKAEHEYSVEKFKAPLCRPCQAKAKKAI